MEYLLIRTNWIGNRFSAQTADGRELYSIKGSATKAKFFVPGDEQPRFECRLRSIFSTDVLLVESAVDYTFATIKGKGEDWLVLDPVGAELAVLTRGTKALSKTDMKGLSTWAALKEFGKTYADATRHLELTAQEQPVVTFDLAKNYKSVAIKVLKQARGIDERIIFALALRCLAAKPQSG